MHYLVVVVSVVLLVVIIFMGGFCCGRGGSPTGKKDDSNEVVNQSDTKPPSTPNAKESKEQQVIVISGEGYKFLINGQMVGDYKDLEREVEKYRGSLFDLSAFRERPQTYEKVSKLVKRFNGKIKVENREV